VYFALGLCRRGELCVLLIVIDLEYLFLKKMGCNVGIYVEGL